MQENSSIFKKQDIQISNNEIQKSDDYQSNFQLAKNIMFRTLEASNPYIRNDDNTSNQVYDKQETELPIEKQYITIQFSSDDMVYLNQKNKESIIRLEAQEEQNALHIGVLSLRPKLFQALDNLINKFANNIKEFKAVHENDKSNVEIHEENVGDYLKNNKEIKLESSVLKVSLQRILKTVVRHYAQLIIALEKQSQKYIEEYRVNFQKGQQEMLTGMLNYNDSNKKQILEKFLKDVEALKLASTTQNQGFYTYIRHINDQISDYKDSIDKLSILNTAKHLQAHKDKCSALLGPIKNTNSEAVKKMKKTLDELQSQLDGILDQQVQNILTLLKAIKPSLLGKRSNPTELEVQHPNPYIKTSEQQHKKGFVGFIKQNKNIVEEQKQGELMMMKKLPDEVKSPIFITQEKYDMKPQYYDEKRKEKLQSNTVKNGSWVKSIRNNNNKKEDKDKNQGGRDF